jgi:hypothetical protein
MNVSFGIDYQPKSLAWHEIRKGPSLEAVREHLDRVVNFARFSQFDHVGRRTPQRRADSIAGAGLPATISWFDPPD